MSNVLNEKRPALRILRAPRPKREVCLAGRCVRGSLQLELVRLIRAAAICRNAIFLRSAHYGKCARTSTSCRAVTILVSAQIDGKCLRFPVTRKWAFAACAHSRKMSSSGSEHARILCDGLTHRACSRIARSALSISHSLRLNRGRRMTSSYSE
jgi:hypothetical protein